MDVSQNIVTVESEISASVDVSVDEIATQIESRINRLNRSQLVHSNFCIFNTPRKFGEGYYVPYVPRNYVIGPLLYYEVVAVVPEEDKHIYLSSFLDRARPQASLTDFITLIESSLAPIQACYETMFCRTWDDTTGYVRQENRVGPESHPSLLVPSILLDACFILEILLRAYDSERWRVENDLIFAKSGTIHEAKRDLMLLQNQLPMFLLRDMYELAFHGKPDFPCFLLLAYRFFSHYYNQTIPIEDVLAPNNPITLEYRSKLLNAKHFTDLIRTFQQPGPLNCDINDQTVEERGEYLYSAVLLSEAGVKFKASSSKCLFDIEFDERNGKLQIPPLKIEDTMATLFANLVVWESCYYPIRNETFMCDYIFLMSYLVKSDQDVDLLVRRRIIINQLGNPQAIVGMFNDLSTSIKVEKNQYACLFMKLNAYNAVPRHGLIANLKLQYFSTLWKGVATVAATILLVLTLIQTICSVISLV